MKSFIKAIIKTFIAYFVFGALFGIGIYNSILGYTMYEADLKWLGCVWMGLGAIIAADSIKQIVQLDI